jgi:hypothetical protein
MTRLPLRQGLDFSAEPPGSAAIKAIGCDFVLRYAVNDYRGLKQYEADDYAANGIDVAMVYEGAAAGIRGGYTQGLSDARYAHSVCVDRGLPATMPIYFACDYDIGPSEFQTLLMYLQGAGEAIGPARVGLYGGFSAIDLAANTGMVWLWQTSAWEYGRGLHPKSILYQHAYNYFVNGTNCDRTDAYAENFGQAAKFGVEGEASPPVTVPAFPKPDLPDFYDRVNGQRHPSAFKYNGRTFYPVRANVVALDATRVYTDPSRKTKAAADVATGQKIAVDWLTNDDEGHALLVNGNGYYYGAKFDPRLVPPAKRGGSVDLVP